MSFLSIINERNSNSCFINNGYYVIKFISVKIESIYLENLVNPQRRNFELTNKSLVKNR